MHCVCLCIKMFENFLSENFNEFATHEIVTILRIANMSLVYEGAWHTSRNTRACRCGRKARECDTIIAVLSASSLATTPNKGEAPKRYMGATQLYGAH